MALNMGVGLYIITDTLCLVFAILELLGNGLVIYLFIARKMDSKRNLRLFLYLAIADIFFGVLILPQIIYMTFFWRPDQVDYNPTVMSLTGWPLTFFLKFTGAINCGAAVERILALFFPVFFRHMNHILFSNIVILISFIISSIDLVFGALSFRYIHILNCSSIGCFVDNDFRLYWGTTNMMMSMCVVILSFVVFIKIRKRGDSLFYYKDNEASKYNYTVKYKKIRLANRTTCGILLSSLVCTAVPSLLVSLVQKIANFSLFQIIGPFYVLSLLASGLMNSGIFLLLNIGAKSNIEAKKSSDIPINGAITVDITKKANSQPTPIS